MDVGIRGESVGHTVRKLKSAPLCCPFINLFYSVLVLRHYYPCGNLILHEWKGQDQWSGNRHVLCPLGCLSACLHSPVYCKIRQKNWPPTIQWNFQNSIEFLFFTENESHIAQRSGTIQFAATQNHHQLIRNQLINTVQKKITIRSMLTDKRYPFKPHTSSPHSPSSPPTCSISPWFFCH